MFKGFIEDKVIIEAQQRLLETALRSSLVGLPATTRWRNFAEVVRGN